MHCRAPLPLCVSAPPPQSIETCWIEPASVDVRAAALWAMLSMAKSTTTMLIVRRTFATIGRDPTGLSEGAQMGWRLNPILSGCM